MFFSEKLSMGELIGGGVVAVDGLQKEELKHRGGRFRIAIIGFSQIDK